MARDEDNDLEYRIVEATSAEELEEKVNKLLEKGWRLQGGICTASGAMHGGNQTYCQALVRDH